MGTRSTIAIQMPDGTILRIYCQFDGYLKGNGKILQEHYSTPDKLMELIQMGDMSSLGPTLAECEFYHRDCNKSIKETEAEEYGSVAEWMGNIDYVFHEYNYIMMKNGKWYVYVLFKDFFGSLEDAFAWEKEEEDDD